MILLKKNSKNTIILIYYNTLKLMYFRIIKYKMKLMKYIINIWNIKFIYFTMKFVSVIAKLSFIALYIM